MPSKNRTLPNELVHELVQFISSKKVRTMRLSDVSGPLGHFINAQYEKFEKFRAVQAAKLSELAKSRAAQERDDQEQNFARGRFVNDILRHLQRFHPIGDPEDQMDYQPQPQPYQNAQSGPSSVGNGGGGGFSAYSTILSSNTMRPSGKVQLRDNHHRQMPPPPQHLAGPTTTNNRFIQQFGPHPSHQQQRNVHQQWKVRPPKKVHHPNRSRQLMGGRMAGGQHFNPQNQQQQRAHGAARRDKMRLVPSSLGQSSSGGGVGAIADGSGNGASSSGGGFR